MDADLDLLLITVFCIADDLLPEKAANARRRLSDAEVITLLVAQSMMGITSDRRFLRAAGRQLTGLFPSLIGQSGWHKRRARLVDELEHVLSVLARECPGYWDDVVVIDSTPVETARSRETVKRAGAGRLGDAIADAAAYGYCPSHSRWFFGMRLHGVFGLDGTPRALRLLGADRPERDVALSMLPGALRGGETIIGDKNYSGRDFAAAIGQMGALLLRPPRKDEPQTAPRLAKVRQRVESIFWTCKDLLSLERHGARTLHNLRGRVLQRMLALTAGIYLNSHLGRPTRALANYTS
ncbi:transposase [Paraconexibacter antarcticus]|uniref:Transposase n=1 Tax=Paraconexibacter antarcticus TaxID=2949664 RepID=A0ABY5DUS6_9ACTN|nr:transposase [Paraconexibacter antarcticus]UTI63077.1 transposase [Paraconexibacter antarcticus]UTI64210.1 transposase [Paraconexibacter antarcticus]UTI64837.1 transposase [Paraconexibacter antarcticus]